MAWCFLGLGGAWAVFVLRVCARAPGLISVLDPLGGGAAT
jgi:hypothetical protein